MNIEQAFEEAEKLAARAATEGEVPVGAVVLRGGEIIGRGYNLRETRQSPTAHAEIIAIEEAALAVGSWRLNECELVVTLEPCPMCLGALQQARISQVYYGANDQKGGALSLGYRLHENEKTNHRFLVEWVERPRSSGLLKEFFAGLRSKKSNPSSDS